MLTKLKVNLANHSHIINYRANHCDVFNSNNNKEIFLQIINKNATIYKIVINTYF